MKLSVRDLSFRYKERAIFSGICCEMAASSFTCLIGANGAGKSTLLKCLNGLLRPASGRVLADEADVQSLSLKQRAQIFGYVPQFTVVNPSLNVMETVISGRMPRMSGKASEADVTAAENVLKEMGLLAFALRPLQQLSGGERQRVLIARALAQEPRFMLLDEPTSNLDLRYQLDTMELMRELAKQRGIGVVAVIHDLNAVLRFADQAILLCDGVVLSSEAPEKVISKENLRAAFRIETDFTQARELRVMVPRHSLRENE